MTEENSINDDVTMRACDSSALGRIDQYELVRELGGGGFGCVYLARDTVAGVDVAVKGLPPEVRHNREELENIRENFALVSRLHHPNIAAALVLHPAKSVAYSSRDVMEKLRVFEGDTLMVMEYAPGTTLSCWRKQFPGRRVPPDAAMAIVRQIASALDYAHERKIVHRDIKPANVMIDQEADGAYSVKVLDFGLAAEIRSSMGRVSREIHDTSGTRPYMAPEQWSGDKQGPATDQYALAVLLHELVTGSVPHQSAFESGDPVLMMANVLHQSIRLREDIPADMRKALLKALSKKPEDRFAKCSDFVASVIRRPFPWHFAVFGLLGMALCAAVWWRFMHVPAERPARDVVGQKSAERRPAEEGPERLRPKVEIAEVERPADAETDIKVREDESRIAAEQKAAEERRARAEAERKARDEAARKEESRIAAEQKAAEERRAKAEAERKAKEEAARKEEARIADERKADEERRAKAEAERKARQAKADAERKAAREALLQRLGRGSEFVPASPGCAAGTKKRISLPNGAYMDLVWCPPGRFLMGSPKSEDGRNPDETQHLVTLTKGFWIGKTEVTRTQWKAIMGDAGFAWTSLWGGDGDFPIDTVSWHQCREFCAKAGRGLRLPTEAEWEYACRAGTATPFDFGSSLNGHKANCSGGAEPYGTHVSGPNSFGSKRVGSYRQNPWGLHDMHGNLFEWCADGYADYPTDDVEDPQGDPSGTTRVIRGGCWNFKPKMCRSAFRSRKDPSTADAHTGFRVCCDRLPD